MSKSLTSKIRAPWRWFHWLVSRCDRCRRFGAETYHQNTRYEKREDNIVTLCPCCKQENDEYWAERWSDIYYG
jgi:hypothetical protein